MTTPKGINWNEQFYKLLRLSLGLTQEFPGDHGDRFLNEFVEFTSNNLSP